MLLRFRVANHRSIRDEAELSLVSPSLRTITPPGGDWAAATTRVAAIYGANAAGKSNLLDAIDFAIGAVRKSATAWAEREVFPFQPFLLVPTEDRGPSFYEFSLVEGGVRYDYGFRCSERGVHEEWLFSYPEGRRRRLFVRHGPENVSIIFSRNLSGENAALSSLVRPRTLFLSVAANAEHKLLKMIHQNIVQQFYYARYNEFDKNFPLAMIMQQIEREDSQKNAIALPKMADIGIVGVRTETKKISARQKAILLAALGPKEVDTQALGEGQRFLTFTHATKHEADFEIPQDDQSSGTLAWLALAMPALHAFQHGGVLLVDELDASLHPHLAAALIGMFKDSEINRSGAQLVFTTHGTAFMSPESPVTLEPAEIWFTEKDADGATELYSLAEYPTRASDNFSRRYLGGRYGAIPIIDPDALSEVLGGART
ncbi:ATP/GTP-binding protein [Frankia sp. AgB32]|uniref:AAA family ATPase n=1 Tax=Frankia sp. AgB32 TaxID=631119 RepID=UPI00200C2BFF|nr:ATP-binding protein [Frankia sp. AgB32]MCK9895113.1 ATP-binding protein [Frankia sp. AgB32]